MRISDWSSDVCSSDLYVRYLYGAPLALLLAGTWFGALDHPEPEVPARFWPIIATAGVAQIAATIALLRSFQARGFALGTRSEERRVGKEGVSTCRSRWSPEH